MTRHHREPTISSLIRRLKILYGKQMEKMERSYGLLPPNPTHRGTAARRRRRAQSRATP